VTNDLLIRDEVTESTSRAGLRCALRGEWTKFWSLRSAGWSVFALAFVTYGLCYLSTSALRGHAQISDPIMRVLVGFNFGQFVMGVLGVLFLSSEYSTGQIRSTMAAMPRRGIVLAAKAIVVGGVGLVLGEVLSFSTYFLGHFILSGQASQISLSQPGVLRVLIESGIDLAIVGLIGLGIAAIVRSSAASLSIFTSIMLVLTVVFFALPGVVVNVVSRYLPANISSTIFSATIPSQLQGTPLFSPLNGLFLMALYALALLSVGAWMMARRDT
jgi:ABC-2 type transport system permease protein